MEEDIEEGGRGEPPEHLGPPPSLGGSHAILCALGAGLIVAQADVFGKAQIINLSLSWFLGPNSNPI